MSRTRQVLAGQSSSRARFLPRGPHLQGSEFAWAVAFLIPYTAVFLAFAVYPIGYGLSMGRDPALYAELYQDPRFARSVINTLVFVGLGVNITLFLALLLSGFFMRRRGWIKTLLVIYVLPWALPAVPAYLSFHWMLIGEQGLVNGLLAALFGIDGPIWFNHRGLALGQYRRPYLEMDAVLDGSLSRRPHGDS